MKINPTIQFINHASVIISDGKSSILTDPWYRGSVFNNAWNLLYENNYEDIKKIIKKINYIWISHEHPDHFSVDFFLKFSNQIINQNIKILFQKTIDLRVVNFFKKNNFEVIELKENVSFFLNEKFYIQIFKFGFYDSGLILNINDIKIFNLNDCALRTKKEIYKFKKTYGKCDILLSQFSYAAWKGGADKKVNRINASKEKINSIKNQISILNPKAYIPFASLIYFSHKDNFYMNDSINKINEINDLIYSDYCKTIVMKPYETQEVLNLNQDNQSLFFWSKKYDQIDHINYNNYLTHNDLINIKLNFENYKEKVFKKNSKFLMFLFKILTFNFLFPSIKIYIRDLNLIIIFSFFNKIKIYKNKDFDISIHSDSLIFILKNTFGFDTLTVNGLFEIFSIAGFRKVVYNFGIGNLNNLGFTFNIKLLFNFKLIIYTLKTYFKSKQII